MRLVRRFMLVETTLTARELSISGVEIERAFAPFIPQRYECQNAEDQTIAETRGT
jgi:hypothetical protein